jgi:kynureninase
MDHQDELAAFRDEFFIADPDLIYLDGNSLGRLPRRTVERMRRAVEHEWGGRLIQGWNDGWIHAPARLGNKIARLVGAADGEVLVTEGTSINLFKLVVAALRARPERCKIVSDVFNFPSDLYILQGIIDLLTSPPPGIGTFSGWHHHLACYLLGVGNDTALVCLTIMAFERLHATCRATGWLTRPGMVLWDLSPLGGLCLDLGA